MTPLSDTGPDLGTGVEGDATTVENEEAVVKEILSTAGPIKTGLAKSRWSHPILTDRDTQETLMMQEPNLSIHKGPLLSSPELE